VLVLGGEGMLGHKVFQILRARFEGTRATVRGDANDPCYESIPLLSGADVIGGVDVMDWTALEARLAALQPATVVNCVGVIKQREAAHEAIPSIAINALLPHRLADLLSRWGGRLIHVSTDCVFSGSRGRYSEQDTPDAPDLYGRTKALGEVVTENALTLRTSIIGRELSYHRSLLDWFLAQNGTTVRGFTRVLYSGVTTNYLARLMGDLVESHPSLSGLYQVAGDPIAKHDLLVIIRDAFGMTVTIEPDATLVSDKTLRGEAFVAATGLRTPPWQELVQELADDPTPYRQWCGFPPHVQGKGIR
jgi:dTDP-4-dehydrorhamnose reductase